ncbi:MAG: thymidine phosphorylase [Oscillospiraceae bacterium]|nr:thymidine phosphorylase [Oscillospiraceae bacterium]
MNMYEIISKTKRGIELTAEEIKLMVDGYVKKEIPDYQMSAWLMAVCFKSLTQKETLALTEAMRDSGDLVDLTGISTVTVDKHSTGGVGDKTSLIIGPVVAACGVSVPKMSGKGLGHTGGTIDKLESIPGCKTQIPFEQFIDHINKTGFSIVSQSGNLVPADKLLYALRDVTATVDSIPLICSSIMSKKLAMGADCILLDVKMGSGAFMKNTEDALSLAELMVSVGKNAGKKCMAVVTDMDIPLGKAIGNTLEVIEATEILKGNDKGRLYELCMELSAYMLVLAGKGTKDECRKLAQEAIVSGKALEVFKRSVMQQGGDTAFIDDYGMIDKATLRREVYSLSDGYIVKMDSEVVGRASLALGAGRVTKESSIDYTAGIMLEKEYGDYVKKGEKLMTLITSSDCDIEDIAGKLIETIEISENKPQERPVIIKTVG